MLPPVRLLLTLIGLFIIQSLTGTIDLAFAEGEFQTDYVVTYNVQTSGKTNITQEVTLKNKTANFYADKFELKIGSTKVEDVKASDSAGPMETTVQFENNLTSISVKFNQKVIGLDKTLPWTLSYSSNELATQSGQIWEVSIPKVADSPDIATYQAKVLVPKSFGPIATVLPAPTSTSTAGLIQEFVFGKSQLVQSGISMSFGEKQVFTFELNYFLENNNLTSQLQEIALPPDNNYQKVVIEKVDPQPLDVSVDGDGNFLAKYKLAPKTQIPIKVTGYVEVAILPFRNIFPKLTETEKSRYTQPQRYWETDNAQIKEKAAQFKTPKAIYDYVVETLSYSQDRLQEPRIERNGASQALQKPQESVCMEFTDLFIAIARAAGIPAREVEGYAYTQNERLRPLSLALSEGDVLHAWPEYWDENLGWVQIDPTWGSTSGGLDYFNKLDFNHITFVQRGISSTSPFPAGAYKSQQDSLKKSVFVNFAQELPATSTQFDLSLNLPSKIISGIPVRVGATIQNSGPTSVLGGKASLVTNLKSSSSVDPLVTVLPPFARRQLSYTLQTPGFFKRSTETVTFKFADQSTSRTVTIIPIYFLFFSPAFVASLSLALIVLAAGFLLYKKLRPKLRVK